MSKTQVFRKKPLSFWQLADLECVFAALPIGSKWQSHF